MTDRFQDVRVFVQARMSSRRFPGKVLAPLAGRPIIGHVVDRLTRVVPLDRVTVLTSEELSDDPLAAWLRECGVPVFRGPLDDVFARFRDCLDTRPCRWFFRVSADSPLVDPAMVERMLAFGARPDVDLVTNVFPRSFPRGQSLEMVSAAGFRAIDPASLTAEQREHVTLVYYQQAERFRIVNVESDDPRLAATTLAVDTVEDLHRLEAHAVSLTGAS